jgi:hypothetical protein
MSAFDVVLIAAIIFALGTAFFATHFILNTTYDQLLGSAQINQSAQAVTMLQGSKNVTSQFDYVIFGVFIGLTLAIIITGWYIGGSSLFMAIYFLVIVISVVMSAILSNVWEQMSQMVIFGATLLAFPITNNLMMNLPIYISVIGFIGIIVMFAKPAFTSSGGGSEY